LHSHGSIDYARQAAQDFAEAARRELGSAYAGASPGPDLSFLSALLDYLVTRDS